jgi:hypothetical protein
VHVPTDLAVALILSRSGLLHLARCGLVHDGYRFNLDEGEELLGFLGLGFRGLCRRCLRGGTAVSR